MEEKINFESMDHYDEDGSLIGIHDLCPMKMGHIQGMTIVSADPQGNVDFRYEPQQEGEYGDDRRVRIGNNRYHVPKAKARAKAKARKQAQKAQRRRG